MSISTMVVGSLASAAAAIAVWPAFSLGEAGGSKRKLWLGGAILAIGAATATYAAVGTPDGAVLAVLKARLPKTEVTKIDCTRIGSLCEVTAGSNLFYVDRSARYLVVGHVYDMQTRQDLTAARLLELDPDRMIGGAAAAQHHGDDGSPEKSQDYPIKPVAQQEQPGLQKVSLESLPREGAIPWGHGSRMVTIFTDFRCSYCRALVNALSQMNVRVIERPISVLGSRDIANRVYCAKDKEQAVRAAYAGEPLPDAKCDTSGLDVNERFAKSRGFTGTPVIVRGDGAMIEGYRPREFLETWLKGDRP